MRRGRHNVQSTVLIIMTGVFVVVTAGFIAGSNSTPPIGQPYVSDSPNQFHYDVVTSLLLQEKGLGGRTDIPHNYGMLFVFDTDGRYGFWMKDMLVPIDMVWLSDDGTVVGIEDSVPTNSYPHVFYPPQPVRYVLETRAGEASMQGWTIGSRIDIPLQD